MATAKEKIKRENIYSQLEAVELAIETSKVKFDASVELHLSLGIDPKKGEQQVRATASLPHGTGKSNIVAAFVDTEHTATAKSAGADFVYGEDDIADIAQTKNITFDVAISTPKMMPKLAKIAQILGPRGLMPNPKTDTVGTNVEKMVKDQKGGKIAFKNDNTSNLHILIGKVSFGSGKINENLTAVLDVIKRNKPASSKGIFIKSATLTTSMGPGIRFDAS
jgi:large subunit ribosomal protein L1